MRLTFFINFWKNIQLNCLVIFIEQFKIFIRGNWNEKYAEVNVWAELGIV